MRSVWIGVGVWAMCLVPTAQAQSRLNELEARVQALETHANTLQSSMVKFSDYLQSSLQEYSVGLDASLTQYFSNLEAEIEQRLKTSRQGPVILDLGSQEFQRVDTPLGFFFIAVDKVVSRPKGVRIYFKVGNPNYANYKKFKLKLVWGKAPPAQRQGLRYQDWHRSLNGIEYTYAGTLQAGHWNQVEVEVPVDALAQLAYLECEIEVGMIELGVLK